MRRIHGLKAESSGVTVEIGILDQILDRLNNLHSIQQVDVRILIDLI